MKTALIIISIIILIIVGYLVVLSKNSQTGKAAGLVSGKLQACPDTPNCLCSEQNDDTDHFTPPIDISHSSASESLKILKEIITGLNGEIQTDNGLYVSAIFSSSLFGFVDDFEMRVDLNHSVIHIRSASRVGRGDLGANKKRIELIKKLYLEKPANG